MQCPIRLGSRSFNNGTYFVGTIVFVLFTIILVYAVTFLRTVTQVPFICQSILNAISNSHFSTYILKISIKKAFLSRLLNDRIRLLAYRDRALFP